jgi:hypothetical protein
MEGRTAISAARDIWLEGAERLANSGQLEKEGSLIAVYSVGPGEETLARWIPFYTQSPVYNFRSDDFIVNIFSNSDPNAMKKREEHVRAFVENGSISSCLRLQADGVRQVWLTPNLDLNRLGTPSNRPHTILKVDCSRLNNDK